MGDETGRGDGPLKRYGEDAALAIVRHSWDGAYEIAEEDIGRLAARRLDGKGGPIRAVTADELAVLLSADYLADPVPRELPAGSR